MNETITLTAQGDFVLESAGGSMTLIPTQESVLGDGNVAFPDYGSVTDNSETVKPAIHRLVTIRHNKDYSDDTVEVLDGTRQLGMYTDSELNPFRLAEILRWFGHTVRVVDYMFEHDIAEFG